MEMGQEDVTEEMDFLDAALNIENEWFQQGFNEGKAAGRQRGHEEGVAVGYVLYRA